MPKGVIISAIAVFAGGSLGSVLGDRISDELKRNMYMLFGLCSLGMGVSSIVLMKNMPAVVLSLILGTILGISVGLSGKIRSLVTRLTKGSCSEELITVIILFCASSTGMYGALMEGISGDSSILFTKAILDFFASLIFACTLKKTVAYIAFPQFLILLLLFVLAKQIVPFCSESMISDFKACGGFIMLATGFRLLKLIMFPTADMIPSMLLVMPLSFLWTELILSMLI